MIIDPNNRLFDRVPDLFLSPYPADETQANEAFQILMERAKGGGQTTVGEDLLSQAGAEAWNQATQLLWKKKATLSGDVLGEVWGKVAWEARRDAGLGAEVLYVVSGGGISRLPSRSWADLGVGFGRGRLERVRHCA